MILKWIIYCWYSVSFDLIIKFPLVFYLVCTIRNVKHVFVLLCLQRALMHKGVNNPPP